MQAVGMCGRGGEHLSIHLLGFLQATGAMQTEPALEIRLDSVLPFAHVHRPVSTNAHAARWIASWWLGRAPAVAVARMFPRCGCLPTRAACPTPGQPWLGSHAVLRASYYGTTTIPIERRLAAISLASAATVVSRWW